MKRQLNISDMAPFAEGNEHIAVRGNFFIINSTSGVKDHVVGGGMGDLLYIPMGRVMMVTGGTARLRLNLQPCRVEKGVALVIPENFFMEVLEVSDDYDARIATLGDIPVPFRRWTAVTMGDSDARRVGRYFDLLWMVANSRSCCQATLDNLLSALLSDLHGLADQAVDLHPAAPPTAAEQLAQRFFDLLAESDGTMRSVAAFADRLCVLPNHLSAVVRGQSGRTVMQLLNAHAVMQAKVLLRHSRLSIAGVSDRLGFENPPSFTRFFKRETGHTPREFQKKSL